MVHVQDSLGEHLVEAISESFENLIFTEVEEVTELQELPALDDAIHIHVDTLKPFRSQVVLIVDNDFAEEIYIEMLGGDLDEANEDLLKDALGEIGNTVVGKFLSNAVSEDEEFSLGFPSCTPYDPESMNYKSSAGCKLLKLSLEDNTLYVVLMTKNDSL